MRGNVVIPSILPVPSRVGSPSFDLAAKMIPFSPRLIGFAVSATLHGFLGVALFSPTETPSKPEVESEILVVEFVPVGVESAHPKKSSQDLDLAVRGDEPSPQRLALPAASRSDPVDDTFATEQRAQSLDSVTTEHSPAHNSSDSTAIARARLDKGAASATLRTRYESAVLARIEGAKRYPTRARHRRLEGSLTVKLHLRPDGGVNSVLITRSSGIPLFDQEALHMVSRAIPFPPAPAEIDPAMLTFSVPIVFRFQ